MSKEFMDAVLNGAFNNGGDAEQVELMQQFHECEKGLKKLKKKSKKKGGKKLKKRIKKLKRQQDKILERLVALERRGKPIAYSLPEILLESVPKVIDLGTELMKGINQKKK